MELPVDGTLLLLAVAFTKKGSQLAQQTQQHQHQHCQQQQQQQQQHKVYQMQGRVQQPYPLCPSVLDT
jgi:outer membrane biogenesis lipoprotein LolB